MLDTARPVTVASREVRNIDLATMSLEECHDLWTAIEAGILHGLPPREALRTAFHKWLGENADAAQVFGLVNFYATDALGNRDTSKAFVNHKAFMEYAVITMAEQDKAIRALSAQVQQLTALLPYLPPATE